MKKLNGRRFQELKYVNPTLNISQKNIEIICNILFHGAKLHYQVIIIFECIE